VHSVAIAPSNPQTIWATTNDGNVQVTFDGGGQWQLVRQGLPGWFRVMRQVTVAADDHLTAYLAGSAYDTDNVLRTTDGGQTWEVLDGNLPDVPVNVIAVDVRPDVNVIYAGTEFGVYRTRDDGVSWDRFGDGLPNTAVIDLRLDSVRRRLVAATQGRGAWIIDICPPDVDGNGTVDVNDLFAVINAWGTSGGPEDVNNDGNVNVDDLFEVVNGWGECE
jgi:photosystem II stability/assembly factor-like uncharacterized protein